MREELKVVAECLGEAWQNSRSPASPAAYQEAVTGIITEIAKRLALSSDAQGRQFIDHVALARDGKVVRDPHGL